MRAPRRHDLDAVFLDAGNTLVTLDHGLVCEVLAAAGGAASAGAPGRPQAGSRPAVSAFLADGGSSEGRDTFTVYVGCILERLGADAAAIETLAPRVVRTLKQDVGTQRLWSQVLPGVPEGLRGLGGAGRRLGG